MDCFLSFDVGGTAIKFGILNEQGEILKQGKIDTPSTRSAFIELIISVKNALNAQYKLLGVAFSMPGFVNSQRGYLATAGAIKYLYNFEFKNMLSDKLGLPVELENDVNCVALAEKWQGNAQLSENFLCLSIGTGIGGAVFLNNQLIHGHQNMAGEFGYMLTENIFYKQDKLVTLSDKGSVRDGLIHRYIKLTPNLNHANICGEDIYHLASQEDKLALQAIDEFYQALAIGLYNLTFILNPEKILIGGAISQRSDIYSGIKQKFQQILDYQNDLQAFKVDQLTTIEHCKFNNDSGLIGAVYHFINMTKNRLS